MAGFWFLDLFFFFLNPAKTEKIYSVVYIRVIFNVFNLLAYCCLMQLLLSFQEVMI